MDRNYAEIFKGIRRTQSTLLFFSRNFGLVLLLSCCFLLPFEATAVIRASGDFGAGDEMTLIPVILGQDTACAGSVEYQYNTEPGMTSYDWTVSSGGSITSGQGTASIIVTWATPGMQSVGVTYTGATSPGTLDVAVFPVVPAGAAITASSNPSCSGSPVTFSAVSTNGGPSPSYQWVVNGMPVGPNSSVYTFTPVNGDVVVCLVTSNSPCVTGNPATSNPIVVSTNPVLPVSTTISASANPVCQGTAVNFTANTVNGGSSPAFQWKVNGINSGNNSSVFSYQPANGDVVTCQLTSSLPCASGNPATSNAITMTVGAQQLVSISVSASSNPSCLGYPVTFTSTVVNGGISPSYSWKVNNSNAGNGSSLTYVPADGDQVKCILTSSISCSSNNPATSNTIQMSVSPSAAAGISITSSSNPTCQGDLVTFTANPSNGGASPVFQWMINGFPVGQNTPTYSFTPANGDIITCLMTSSLPCAANNPAGSNPVTMTVLPVQPVVVSISASSNPVCASTSVTFTATPINEGSSPVYQWKVNDIPAGTGNPVFTYTPQNGDVVTCTLTSSSGCPYGNPAVSNAITIVVSPVQQASISIAASATTVCQNTPVTITASTVNGGPSPMYQWKVNGVNVGTNGPVFIYMPANGDIVTCELTSNASCLEANPVVSNALPIVVIPSQGVPVGVSITASGNPGCMGQAVTFTASPVNGGSNPQYQWMVNGLNVGGNNPVYSYNPTTGDKVKCILTSDLTCATGNPASSNEITMSMNPIQTVNATITASANPSCQGTNVNYTAIVTNGGPSPSYQWKVNGVNSGLNQSTFSYAPSTGNVITCVVASSIACPAANPVTSNAITMTVNQTLPVTIAISTLTNPSCTGTHAAYNAVITNGGTSPKYQWKLNGANVGTNNATFSIIPLTGDVIACELTSNAICYSGPKIVMSNTIVMTVSDEIVPAVSISTPGNPFCEGSPVNLTATPVNGGTTPVYQWTVNCVNTGTNSPLFTYIPAEGDFVQCKMTSNLVCAIQNPTKSNAITMTKNTGTPVSVSINPTLNPVCAGTPVTFTPIPVNGGSAPTYSWFVNNIQAGIGSVFTYTPVNGDNVTCKLTSSATCASGNPAISPAVVMNVSAALPVGVSIATPTNPFCSGTNVNFTATPSNGGISPVYLWKVNGNPVGTNSPTLSYPAANGDVVICQITSNSSCISGPATVVSNAITLAAGSSLPVSVSIAASANNICQGTQVKFTATPVNGGNNPGYQWRVNGSPVGTDQSSFTYAPANGEVVSCLLTSDLACASGNPALSNAVTMAVNPVLPVSISITASSNPCCQGTPITFTASGINPGTAPVYQWKVNCQNVGTNSTTYTYIPQAGDVIICILNSNVACSSGNPAVSNNINMVVLPIMPVSNLITVTSNPFCIGSPVTFFSFAQNEGTAPTYQWRVNGVNTGPNNSELTYVPTDGDVVDCIVTSSSICVTGNPAQSNQITMTGNNALPVTISISGSVNNICHGTSVAYSAIITNGGTDPLYQWKVNGAITGPNNPNFQYFPENGDIVTCELISSMGCATPNPAISNPITMIVYPKLTVSVNVTVSQNPSCVGNQVCFNATVTNGGTTPFYRWRVNGANQGTNSPDFCYVPLNGDVIYCRVTSNATCATNNPANSNNITMIVNPIIPASVSIAASANPVCQGTTVTFTATPVNGGTAPVYQWKVNGNNQGTNSPTYTYAPQNGDVIICEMTSNSPCATVTFVTSNPVTMTVSPNLPVSVSVSASSNPTCINSAVVFSAVAQNGGTNPAYLWKVNGVNSGTNSPMLVYTPLNGDNVKCVVTSDATCTSGNPSTSNTIQMTVSQSLPVSVNITAGSNPVCMGQPVSFSATPVNGGPAPSYHWFVNGISVGGNSTTFTYNPSNGDFVKCQLTSSFSCGSGNPAMSNQIVMGVNPALPASVFITSSSNPVCTGSVVTYTATPFNGGTSPSYQWKINGTVAGTNSPVFSYSPQNGDAVTCILTSNAACATNNPVTSNMITMNVLQPVMPEIMIDPSTNPSCLGSSVKFTATVVNGGISPGYQWRVNGMVTGASLPIFTYTPADGDLVDCQLTSSAPCIGSPTVTSNQVSMTVSTELPVAVSVEAAPNPTCLGLPVTFTATGTNPGTNPTYQWIVNNIYVGNNDPVYTYIPSDGDKVECQLLSDLTCATGNPAVSNEIDMYVISGTNIGVTMSPSTNPACLGSQVTFTAIPENAGPSPIFQWKVNGVTSGANSSQFTYIPVNGDVVTCTVSPALNCAGNSSATSDPVTMIVSSDLPASVYISASANPICSGIPVSFTAIPVNGGVSPTFQWTVNGSNAGTNNPLFTYLPSNGDVVVCHMISSFTCASSNPAYSNPITMSVSTGSLVSVSITANPGTSVCEGTAVTMTASPVNGGTSPVYQWYKNGSPAGGNQSTYTFIPVNGDQVYTVLTSNQTCVSGSPATSNTIAMSVNQPLPVGVSITASQNNVCEGTSVTFTATSVNGGTTPFYQWYRNGSPVGTNQSSYSVVPVNGDQVHVVMTSGLPCVSGNPASSNIITMTINPPLPVSVSVAVSQNNICSGTPVTFTATPVNGGTSPVYQWYRNGNPAGTNQATYSVIPVNGDQVYVVLTSNGTCITGNPATSNIVSMTVNQPLPVSISITVNQNSVCAGTSVSFTATPVNGGTSPVYQWYKNGIPVGTNQPSFSYIPDDGDLVHVVLTSNQVCVTGNPASSNVIQMIVNPVVQAGVTVSASQNNVCEGTSVTFTANPVNGGTSPAYQWYLNGSPTGTGQSTYTYLPMNGDQVYVVMNSNLPCVTGSPATSNTVAMTVNPMVQAGVSISVSQDNICEGTAVTFTATPVNGGATPVYQWFRNGIPVGTNSPTLTFTPVNGDQFYLTMTSSLTCVSGSPANSNVITMTVTPPLPVSVSVSADANNICQGISVTFTAVPVNEGSSPIYQWYRNAVPVGSNGPVYSCIPDNGDQVYVILTSSLSCVSGNPAISNLVSMVVYPIPQTPVATINGQMLASSSAEGNQWYFNGNPIAGATGQTYFATQSGWYWTVVTLNGCVSDSSNHIYLVIVGVENNQPESSFNVYPVPNEGIFNIMAACSCNERLTITIYNELGSRIREIRDEMMPGRYNRTVDLRPLADGIYSVVMQCGDQAVVKRIIVKNR